MRFSRHSSTVRVKRNKRKQKKSKERVSLAFSFQSEPGIFFHNPKTAANINDNAAVSRRKVMQLHFEDDADKWREGKSNNKRRYAERNGWKRRRRRKRVSLIVVGGWLLHNKILVCRPDERWKWSLSLSLSLSLFYISSASRLWSSSFSLFFPPRVFLRVRHDNTLSI